MKAKKIIPRRDHEVYFIPTPEGLKPREVQRFVYDALSELHPGFSATTSVDIQSFVFIKTRWFMVTVIEGETLMEYQITRRGTALYTNTSIMAHAQGFIHNTPKAVDDELIGFDSSIKKPVSLPLETMNTYGKQSLAGKLGHIPLRHGVFTRKKPHWLAAAILAGIAVLLAAPIAYVFISTTNRNNVPVTIELPADEPGKVASMPSAISILTNVAELVVRANGEIDEWQFTEGAYSGVVIQSTGISAATAHTIFNELEYMVLDDIRNVTYNDGKPRAAIILNAKQDAYSLPVSLVFPDQGTMLAAASDLTGQLNNQRVVIVSETFPSAGNNYESYTITYTTDNTNFIRSLEILEELCESYSMRVKRLDIAVSADKKTFTVTSAFSHSAPPDDPVVTAGAEKHVILTALGYKPVTRKQLPVSVMAELIQEQMPIIGSITDSDGSAVFFHDSDGKIQIRSGQ